MVNKKCSTRKPDSFTSKSVRKATHFGGTVMINQNTMTRTKMRPFQDVRFGGCDGWGLCFGSLSSRFWTKTSQTFQTLDITIGDMIFTNIERTTMKRSHGIGVLEPFTIWHRSFIQAIFAYHQRDLTKAKPEWVKVDCVQETLASVMATSMPQPTGEQSTRRCYQILQVQHMTKL